MGDLKAVINGQEVSVPAGTTILEAAKANGIDIPSLCHRPELTPTGSCRVCVVEVEGQGRLAGSCHTPLAQGMVVHTASPKVIRARKAIVELLLTSHTGSCVNDDNARACELHNLAAGLEVGPPRFQVRRPRFYQPESANPYVRRDMSKCILCRRCIGACNEVAKKNVFALAFRGAATKVVVDFDEPLEKEACRDCGICIDYCPTGALSQAAAAG